MGSPLAGFPQTRKYSFLMISPKLLDFSPFFLLIFSPLVTADFLMLLELPGDGYSLLCSKKQPPRHSYHVEANAVICTILCCKVPPPKNVLLSGVIMWDDNIPFLLFLKTSLTLPKLVMAFVSEFQTILSILIIYQ